MNRLELFLLDLSRRSLLAMVNDYIEVIENSRLKDIRKNREKDFYDLLLLLRQSREILTNPNFLPTDLDKITIQIQQITCKVELKTKFNFSIN